MGILTADGNTEVFYGARVTLLLSDDLGGGTFALKRLKSGGDVTVDADWITIQDTDNTASYTTVPTGNFFNLGAVMPIRGTLSGATSPNLEYLVSVDSD